MSCAEHRAYLAAVADGETALVPASTLAHVRTCRACRGEVETHRLLTSRLREAASAPGARPARGPVAARRGSRLPWAAAAAAALVLAAVVTGLLAARGHTDQDPVLAAAAAAQGPPQFQSGDGRAIGAWCERASGRPMPVVALRQLSPRGARFDRLAGGEVLTVDYLTDAGARVTVSWLDAQSVGQAGRRIEARSSGGHTVLLVRSASGSAVVAGDAPDAILWSAAAELQAVTDG